MAEHPVRLFISYAHQDDPDFVKQLYEDITHHGFDVWWDRVSMPSRGLTFNDEIQSAIDGVDRVLVIFGPKALESDYVTKEWRYALNVCKCVTSVLRRGDVKMLPSEITDDHVVKMKADRPYDEAFAELLRVLSEPVAEPGPFWGVKRLPSYYLERPDDLKALAEVVMADLNKPVVVAAEKQVTVLHGMGGMGKSVIATAFAQMCKTRRAFRDGVIQVSIGNEPDIRKGLGDVGNALGDRSENYQDTDLGWQSLQKLLRDRRCLLVLDDVWNARDIQPFLDAITQTRNRLLITTRSTTLGRELNANDYPVKPFTLDQATELLRNICERDDPDFKQIAKKLECLPLALKLSGSLMRDESLSGSEWLAEFERISQIRISRITDDPDRNESLSASIELSVKAAFDQSEPEYLLYHTFGIFDENVMIPQGVVLRLWEQIRPDIDADKRKAYLSSLVHLALVERNDSNRTITLHNLLHDYTREKLGAVTQQTHQDLLKSYGVSDEQAWHDVSFDDYLYRFFPHHMLQAGWQQALFDTVKQAPDWLETNYQRQGVRDLDMETLVVEIWSRFRKHDPDEARKRLSRWLKRGTGVVHPDTPAYRYSSKVVAARCAFEANDTEALARVLRDPNEHVQDVAIRLVFYLDTVRPAESLKILQDISNRVMRFGLPNPKVLRVLFSMTVLLITDRYRRLDDEESERQFEELFGLLRDTVKRITYSGGDSGLARAVGDRARSLVLKLLKLYAGRWLRYGYKDGDMQRLRGTINNAFEYERFFRAPRELRENLRHVIPYIDSNYGSIVDIKDNLLYIFDSPDVLSKTYSNIAVGGRGYREPDAIFETYKYIFETIAARYPDDTNKRVHTAETVAHTLYHSLIEHETIKPEWLAFQKKMVRCTILDGLDGPGIFATESGRYKYHTLMYYGALWSWVYPDQPIDLANELFELAEDQLRADEQRRNGIGLRDYLIDSFGERATFPDRYGGILKSLARYIASNDPEVVERVTNVLAVVRNKNQQDVDDFLSSCRASREFKQMVVRKSFDENISELARRFHAFLTMFLAHADSRTAKYIAETAQSVFEQAESFDQVLELGIKAVLNQLVGKNIFAN